MAAGRGAVRGRARQGNEQEQEDVVDGHDGADGRALIAQCVPHQEWNECAQQRAGHAGKKSAQADNQALDEGCSRGQWLRPYIGCHGRWKSKILGIVPSSGQ